MSSRIEWSTIEADVSYGEPGHFQDQYGSVNSGPAIGIFTGTDGAVIEAPTAEALADFLEDLALTVRASIPGLVIPGEVWVPPVDPRRLSSRA